MQFDVTKKDLGRQRPPFLGEGNVTELVCAQLLFFALGALAGAAELLFGVRPFGVALAAATGLFFPASALGAALFSLIARDYVSLIGLAGMAALRAGLYFLPLAQSGKRPVLFAERVSFRVTGAALTVLFMGIYRVIRGGFRYFDLFGLLLAVLSAGLATFLYAGMFEKKDRFFPYSREAGAAALFLTAVFAMREVSFFGIYPAAVAAACAAFLLVAHRGILWGAVGGALAGFCFDFRFAPAFLLCGLCFGLLEKSSRGGGVLAGSGAAALFAFAVRGSGGIVTLLPALLTAGAIFLAGDSAGLVEGSPGHRISVVRRRAAAQSAKAGEQAASEARLREISGAFLDLSGTFYELSARLRRPGLTDLRNLCDRSFDEICPKCRNRDICWGSEYNNTARTVGALGARLHSHGAVGMEQIPAALTARCAPMPRILESINAGATRLCEEALRGDKTAVVATDYAAMGRILKETLEEERASFATDAAAGERILDRLHRLGYSLESAAVCGKAHRRVILRGVRLPGRHLKKRELRRVLEQHCHFSLSTPEITESEGGYDMTFCERMRYATLTVKETRAKGRGENRYCGDSVMSLSSDKGYDYAFLCDGMGSGNSAALTSALSATFLSRLLQAGGRADTALRMLNGFLAARGTREAESSTTVDLLEIDRVSGEASLFKCGAAPTYLLRRGEITRFFSRTAPVGILESLDAERIRFQVREGDVIVQMSDGVTKGEEDCAWLVEMLITKWDGDADKFARLALNRADEEGRDDLSILITEVSRAAFPGEEREEEGEESSPRASA